ncbi:TPA: DUF551 domain-containing protein [Citrobacter freundii]|nr:DUF551 domain-containing protein [Citrobacter freundii]
MTTNNHPAHGPVSLERLHQISEILSKAAAQSDGGNLGYAMADAVKVIDGAITSFGAEPVAWQWEYRDKRHVTNDQRRAKIVAEDGEVLVQPLYTAPPTSVVPPAIEPDYDVIKGILPTSNPDEYACCIAADMWNACRAAMLQAGNHTEQHLDMVDSGWIPVSERMPDEGSEVIVFRPRAEESNDPPVKTATYKGGREYYHGFDCYCEPTHWMPLPAAPQQEVKS